LSAALLCLLLMAGCRGGQSAEAEEEPAGASLTMLIWSLAPAEEAALRAAVADFEAANQDVSVTVTVAEQYAETLETLLEAGQPPDLFLLDGAEFDGRRRQGALAPLADGFLAPEELPEQVRDAFSAGGDLYCAPRDISTLALVSNTRLFEKAGVAPPDDSWTWETLRAAAVATSDLEQGVFGLSVPADLSRWGVFLAQAGGRLEDLATPRAVGAAPSAVELAATQALTTYVGLWDGDAAAVPGDQGMAWGGEAIARGRAAMAIEGNWVIPYLQEQFADVPFGVAELPAGPVGEASIAFVTCYAAAAGGNVPAATRLIAHLTSPATMRTLTQEGPSMPVRTTLLAPWQAAHPEYAPFVRAIESAQVWTMGGDRMAFLQAFNRALRQYFADELEYDALLDEVLGRTGGS
jgi:multiple sugar transport system substrate-binding protein